MQWTLSGFVLVCGVKFIQMDFGSFKTYFFKSDSPASFQGVPELFSLKTPIVDFWSFQNLKQNNPTVQ